MCAGGRRGRTGEVLGDRKERGARDGGRLDEGEGVGRLERTQPVVLVGHHAILAEHRPLCEHHEPLGDDAAIDDGQVDCGGARTRGKAAVRAPPRRWRTHARQRGGQSAAAR